MINVRVFFLALLVLIFVLAVKRFKIPPRINIFVTWRKSMSVAGIYLLLLLVPVIVINFIPQGDFIQPSRINAQEVNKLEKEFHELLSLEKPTKEDIEHYPWLYRISSKPFEIDSNTLRVKVDGYLGARPIIEQKDENDGTIEVYAYASASGNSALGIDFTDQILPPDITYDKGVLAIRMPIKELRLQYNWFKRDFTVEQFKGPEENSNKLFSSLRLKKVIVIRVPKFIKVQEVQNY